MQSNVRPKENLIPDNAEVMDFQTILYGLVSYTGINPHLSSREILDSIILMVNELKQYWGGGEIKILTLSNMVDDIKNEVVSGAMIKSENPAWLKLTPDKFPDLIKGLLNKRAYETGEKQLTSEATLLVARAATGIALKGHLRRNGETSLCHVNRVEANVQGMKHKIDAVVHDTSEDGKGWTPEIFARCAFSKAIVHTNVGMTRQTWGAVNSSNISKLKDFGYKPGDAIKEPYFDYGVRGATDPDVRYLKPIDMNDNYPDAKTGHKIRYTVMQAYYKAVDFDVFKDGTKIKFFIDNYVHSRNNDVDMDTELLDAIKAVRAIDPNKLGEILKKESSDYSGGRAEFIVKKFRPSAQVYRFPGSKTLRKVAKTKHVATFVI